MSRVESSASVVVAPSSQEDERSLGVGYSGPANLRCGDGESLRGGPEYHLIFLAAGRGLGWALDLSGCGWTARATID